LDNTFGSLAVQHYFPIQALAPAALVAALLFSVPVLGGTFTVTDIGIGTVRGINAGGQATGNLSVGDTNAYIYNSASNSINYVATFTAKAINDKGQLGGNSGSHVMFYDGQTHDLGVPLGGTSDKVYGMNNAGYLTGQVTLTSGTVHGFVYDPTNPNNGGYTEIGTLSGVTTDYSYGSSINASNQVEGDCQVLSSNTPHNTHAFIWQNGQFTVDMGTFGGPASSGTAINDHGHAVGTSQTSASGTNAATWVSHVFLYQGSLPPVDCGTLGGKWANAGGLNDADVVVGRSTLTPDDTNTYHAFIYANGVMTDLNNLIPADSGFTLTGAVGINDLGQIVAQGSDSLGNTHALFLNPTVVPEPTSLSVLTLAGAALLFRRRVGGSPHGTKGVFICASQNVTFPVGGGSTASARPVSGP
jgi:probable HAF family extracellular repeat protein